MHSLADGPEYVPAGQVTHVSKPAIENVPAGQIKQLYAKIPGRES